MSTEALIWGVLPMVFGALIAVGSVVCAWRARTIVQSLAALIVLAGVTWSELFLLSTLKGAWPSHRPHIVLTVALVIATAQLITTLASPRPAG